MLLHRLTSAPTVAAPCYQRSRTQDYAQNPLCLPSAPTLDRFFSNHFLPGHLNQKHRKQATCLLSKRSAQKLCRASHRDPSREHPLHVTDEHPSSLEHLRSRSPFVVACCWRLLWQLSTGRTVH